MPDVILRIDGLFSDRGKFNSTRQSVMTILQRDDACLTTMSGTGLCHGGTDLGVATCGNCLAWADFWRARIQLVVSLPLSGCYGHAVCCWRDLLLGISGYCPSGTAGETLGAAHGGRLGLCPGYGGAPIDHGVTAVCDRVREYRLVKPAII